MFIKPLVFTKIQTPKKWCVFFPHTPTLRSALTRLTPRFVHSTARKGSKAIPRLESGRIGRRSGAPDLWPPATDAPPGAPRPRALGSRPSHGAGSFYFVFFFDIFWFVWVFFVFPVWIFPAFSVFFLFEFFCAFSLSCFSFRRKAGSVARHGELGPHFCACQVDLMRSWFLTPFPLVQQFLSVLVDPSGLDRI